MGSTQPKNVRHDDDGVCSAPLMEIRVHVPRPMLTLTIVAVGILWWQGVISIHMPGQGQPAADAEGGAPAATLIRQAVQDIDRERVKQAVLGNQEEILRYQLQILEDEALKENSPEKIKALADTRAVLLSIIKQRDNSEKLLQLSLEQLWEAEGTAYSLEKRTGGLSFDWPVAPALGISAFFEDASYKKRFGMDHHAVDIPTEQGTLIRAPADATVLKVSMNGLGYSYIVLDHGRGLQTVYGHISATLVSEGDTLRAGQSFAKSGGQPGSAGAGLLTTGPHLHFAVKLDGALVDPLDYLPKISASAE